MTEVNESGGRALPAANATWATEITLDVEWAHAIAPAAHILLVEASSAGAYDLLTAVNTAHCTSGVSVVSMSWGTSEFSSEAYFDGTFTTPATHIGGNGQAGGITFVASSGDAGAWYGPEWPSVSPNVLAVGGTALAMNGLSYAGETAWSYSGGGYSLYEARPSYQATASNIPVRSTPDVAYNADPSTGYYVFMTYAGVAGWYRVAGTSAAAPQWAALLALADQGRAQEGLPSLYAAQSLLYSLPARDFHDITTGYNGYLARPGYDPVTGLGTPYANLVINGLLTVQLPAGTSATQNGVAALSSQVKGAELFLLLQDQTGDSGETQGSAGAGSAWSGLQPAPSLQDQWSALEQGVTFRTGTDANIAAGLLQTLSPGSATTILWAAPDLTPLVPPPDSWSGWEWSDVLSLDDAAE